MAVTTSVTVSLLGALFQRNKRPNNFLRMIGGLQGTVQLVASKEFPTNVIWEARSPGQNVALEGATAPTPDTTTVSQSTNVIQIHQETVGLTYLAESDKTVTGVVAIPTAAGNGEVVNPRSQGFQLMAKMAGVQGDINYSILRGVYSNPANAAATALKTRGALTCIVTNLIDVSADAVSATDPKGQYRGYVQSLIKAVMSTNGFDPDQTWTVFGDANEIGNCAAAFAARGQVFLTPETELAGIRIRRIQTDFGMINLAIEPDMPPRTLGLFDMGVIGLVGLPVGDKGFMFMEPLAKTGSSENVQIYGQIGIDHGPEFAHGKLVLPAFSFNA